VSAAVIPISASPAPTATVLSFEDERDLRIYFALDLPPCPGTPSTFGRMCDRVMNSRNPKTTELPTAGVSWTEIVDCRLRHNAANVTGAEDAFIAYFDTRRRVARVHAALSRMTEHDRDVLRETYASEVGDLAPLTPTAQRENRDRAAKDQHETMGATVMRLRRDGKDMRAAKTNRDDARAKLALMRRETTEMLRRARESYTAAREARG
jgi:signal transduction histidine kinase